MTGVQTCALPISGETIPADGTILEGQTSIDQSVMTGESIPVDKKEGDTVTSGTTNRFGTFSMRADRACGDSSLQRMIRLAEEADVAGATAHLLALGLFIGSAALLAAAALGTRRQRPGPRPGWGWSAMSSTPPCP